MFRGFRSWLNTRSLTSRRNKRRLRTPAQTQEGDKKKNADAGGYQNPRANIFTGEADLNVKEVAQSGGGHHRRKENTEQVSHPKLGRVHRRDLTPAQFTFQDTPEVEQLFLSPVGHFAAVPIDADRAPARPHLSSDA